MKSVLIFLVLVPCVSCTGQKPAAKRIPLYTTFYWEKNTEIEFYALRCDTLNCDLLSLGPNQENSRQTLRWKYEGEAIILTYPESKEKIGKLIVYNDTLVSLQLVQLPDKTYKMIPDFQRFGKLYGLLKGKYSFECVPSNKISYNGITPELTIVDSYLKDKRYKQVTETLEDEIYGSETSNYLDFNGNRFYYIPKKRLFDKVEIVSNDIESSFLDIRIGDTRSGVLKKLTDEAIIYRSGKNEITVDVCNSRFVGYSGLIKFSFRKKQREGQEQVLEKIFYQPLLEE